MTYKDAGYWHGEGTFVKYPDSGSTQFNCPESIETICGYFGVSSFQRADLSLKQFCFLFEHIIISGLIESNIQIFDCLIIFWIS